MLNMLKDKIDKIIQGETLTELKKMPAGSVNCIITSPPYWGLRDYGVEGQLGLEPTIEEFLIKMLAITKELKRVLRKDGVMYWNHGDCYGGNITAPNSPKWGRKNPYKNWPKERARKRVPKCLCLQNYRLILKMVDEQGWILRNTIIWWKPNHMPSSVKDRFANSYEPVYMLVKSKRYWFDLDAVRKPHSVFGYNKSTDSNLQSFNIRERVKKGGKPVGFMASPQENKNQSHSSKYAKGSEFQKKYGEPWDRFGKNAKKSLKERMKDTKSPKGSLAYNMKRTLSEIRTGVKPNYRNKTIQDPNARGLRQAPEPGEPNAFNSKGKNPGDVWRIPTQPLSEAHFAVFPEKLIEPMVLSGCPKEVCKKCGKARTRILKTDYKESEGKWGKQTRLKEKTEGENVRYTENLSAIHQTIGWTDCGCGAGFQPGIVLDPFLGSGTVALVSKRFKRNWLGIELNPEYIKIAKQRIRSQPEPLL